MVPAEDRDEQGQFKSGHEMNAEDILDAMEPLEPYTTGELADQLDIPRRTAYKYLESLHDDNKIRKKKPEPRRVIWIRGS